MKGSSKKMVTLIVVSVIALSALYASGAFNKMLGLTLISAPTNIYVAPRGSAVNGAWTGSYWVFTVAITSDAQMSGVTLPKGQTATVDIASVQTALKTGASITIQIAPQQAYLIRNLQENNVQVTPTVGQTWYSSGLASGETSASAPALNLDYYSWGENQFRIYTPYIVTVLKDGVKVGEKLLDAYDGSTNPQSIQTIPTSEGDVTIENLGLLGGAYTTPQFPSQICIMKNLPNMYDWAQIQSLVGFDSGARYTITEGGLLKNVQSGTSNAYSVYWYGSNRWTGLSSSAGRNGDPAAFNPGTLNVVSTTQYGGWQDGGSDLITARRNPIAPVVGASDKGSLPVSKQNFHSLTQYLEEDHQIKNWAVSSFDKFTPSYVYDSNGQVSALKLAIPWNAYGTPTVNFQVPTELADTWVDQPAAITAVPNAVWESTGNKYTSNTGNERLAISVTSRETTVTGSTNVGVSCANGKVGIYPVTQTVTGLTPGETRTVFVDVTNLGVLTQAANVPIVITCTDTVRGTTTGTDTVFVTLEPTLNTNQTYVNLLVVEKNSTDPIPNLQVRITYGQNHEDTLTDADGKISWTLTTSAGGGYDGSITLQSFADDTYKAATRTATVHPGNPNELTLSVDFQGTNDNPNFDLTTILMIFGIIVVVAVIGGLGYYASKHTKHRGKRVTRR